MDYSGNIEWEKSLGGSQLDQGHSIAQAADGGYMVTGFINSNDGDISTNYGNYDCWIVKLDPSGNIQWEKSLGGSNQDKAHYIEQTADNGFILGGYTTSMDYHVSSYYGGRDCWLVKLDSLGNIQWETSIGGALDEEIHYIDQTQDGGYVIGCTSEGNIAGLNHQGQLDYYIVKLSSVGTIQWQKMYGGSDYDRVSSIEQTSEGGYIVAGSSRSDDGDVLGNHGEYDCWILKLDMSGNILWKQSYGGSMDDNAMSIIPSYDKSYTIFGSSMSTDGDVVNNLGGSDFWVFNIDSLGDIQWSYIYGGSGSEHSQSMIESSDGGFVLSGSTLSNDIDVSGYQGYGDFWIVKIGNPRSYINGQIYKDTDTNCQPDVFEPGLAGILVQQTQPYQRIITTNSQGLYQIPLFDTMYISFKPVIPEYLQNGFVQNHCDSSYSIQISNLDIDTSGFDFGLEIEECHVLRAPLRFHI